MRRGVLAVALASVFFAGTALADLEAPHKVDLSSWREKEANRLSTASAMALDRGDAARALALADRALTDAPLDGWAAYDRGEALATLGRIDEAEQAFDLALKLDGPRDPWSRSVAIYAKARAYNDANMCANARRWYGAYADFVRPYDRKLADDALRVSASCTRRDALVPARAEARQDTLRTRSPFGQAVAAYEGALDPMRAPTDTTFDARLALERLATSVELVPFGDKTKLREAATHIRADEAKLRRDLPWQGDEWQATADALLTASRAFDALARGPYWYDGHVVDRSRLIATTLDTMLKSRDPVTKNSDLMRAMTLAEQALRAMQADEPANHAVVERTARR